MRLIILGTDTDVGKTWITTGLVTSLRQRGQPTWLHKPVACGDWDGVSTADGRSLRALAGDGQDPATICPREFPEACSPHLAARVAGHQVALETLVEDARILGDQAGPRALLVETAGGLLAPLTQRRETNRDLARALNWPCLIVTRPHLGTLNHTCLTVEAARGLDVRGIIINHHQPTTPTLAVRTAGEELAALTGLTMLAEVAYGAPAEAWAPQVLDRLGDMA